MSFVKRHTQIITLVILTLAGPASAATPAAATGKVVSVHDGDTLTVRTEAGETLKIHLHGIDAPEAKQPFGNVSKQALGDLIAGKTVSVEEVDRDRYGRVVERVTIAGKLVNTEMVRAGLAWRYTIYDRRNEFGGLEDAARRQRRGLWTDAAPVAPWAWRKTEKERRKAKTPEKPVAKAQQTR